jgi:hypothetical protein
MEKASLRVKEFLRREMTLGYKSGYDSLVFLTLFWAL